MSADIELVGVCASVIQAARKEWGDGLIMEAGLGYYNPRLLYTETHYALAALLLFLFDKRDDSLLDLAESRLRLWNQGKVPLTFFNSMAICLTATVFQRSKQKHAGLQSILEELLSNTPRVHRDVAYRQHCGNNAYLQQVVVDTVLLPIACGKEIAHEGLHFLIAEFRKFRTPEGFFYDLPREGTLQEPLLPPTYVMKMLFLLGVCNKLHPKEDFAGLFRTGMTSALPLLSQGGNFSYFGRTDNSPFAAGLTIFNLRGAANFCSARRREFEAASGSAEYYFQTFPRTAAGMLQPNRFADAKSRSELVYSRDDYAFVGQYSIASCAYALLGCYWFRVFRNPAMPSSGTRAEQSAVAQSKDLGVVKLREKDYELFLRTSSQVTGWDRRYLGPTVLRYQIDRQLLVGAISRTVSTDEKVVQRSRPKALITRVAEGFRYRYRHGIEQLDGTSVGFLPVIRQGSIDYVPHKLLSLEVSPKCVKSRYQMLQLSARGFHPCFIQFRELLQRNLSIFEPRRYSRPVMTLVDSFEFSRDIYLEQGGCRIADRISGNLNGKTLLFSVRYFPCASVRVEGLRKRASTTGWGSDGQQTLDLYEALLVGSRIQYECFIELGTWPSSSPC